MTRTRGRDRRVAPPRRFLAAHRDTLLASPDNVFDLSATQARQYDRSYGNKQEVGSCGLRT